jgi:predicted RNase H-like nuclease (RuvC/YqgF family)
MVDRTVLGGLLGPQLPLGGLLGVQRYGTFREEDHPRGQPENAGQFAPGGGDDVENHPRVKKARKIVERTRLQLRAAEDRLDASLEHIHHLRTVLDEATAHKARTQAEADRLKTESDKRLADLKAQLQASKVRLRQINQELADGENVKPLGGLLGPS